MGSFGKTSQRQVHGRVLRRRRRGLGRGADGAQALFYDSMRFALALCVCALRVALALGARHSRRSAAWDWKSDAGGLRARVEIKGVGG